MSIIPPGFAEVTYRFEQAGAEGIVSNVVGLDVSGSVTLADAEAIADAFADNVLPELTTVLSMEGVTVRVGQDGGDPLVTEFDYTTPPSGLSPGVVSPPNVAYLVRKNSALGGRRNRGRMYLAGVDAEQLTSAALVAPAKQTSLQLNIDAWVAATLAITVVEDFVILHNDLTVPTPITAFALQPKVATQRTRLRD